MKGKDEIEEIGAYRARVQFSRLLEKVRRGRRIFITRRGRRIAELRPVADENNRPAFGCDRGRVQIGEDFDAPLPEFDEYCR
ncbi:MAG: type II toxin-antitoxin system prevent-host-death family antitoxin [Deltaproteobacteria bacterium]|nr:MAG: type II toxin-antitoxin system prevent-host-death family antitoxin [Deltaproteobacteria bacterium]